MSFNEDHSSSEDRSDSEEYASSNDGEETFKGEMSMEELLNMREKVGSKIFDKSLTAHVKRRERLSSLPAKTDKTKKLTKTKDYIRENKNRPQELSSKKPVRRNNGLSNTKFITRDPRFDEMCGSKFNKDVFEARFSFLSDVRAREKKILGRKLKKVKNPEQKTKLKYLLQRMSNQERERDRKKEENEVIRKWRREEKQKVSQGKKPYFLKDSDKKKLIQEHRKEKKLQNLNKKKGSKHPVK